jgi:hypothetical protein
MKGFNRRTVVACVAVNKLNLLVQCHVRHLQGEERKRERERAGMKREREKETGRSPPD